MDLNLISTFVRVAETKSITSAARDSGLPKSTVSRRIKKLEEIVGSTLFEKRNNNFSLTPAGRRLFDRSRAAIHSLNIQLEEKPSGKGVLRIHTPMVLGRGILAEQILNFMEAWPQCSVEVIYGDRFTDPEPEAIDISLLVGLHPSREFETWPLGNVYARLYASPALFKQRSKPKEPADLEHWSILTPDCDPGTRSVLNLFKDKVQTSVFLKDSRLVSSQPDLLTSAALKGLGIARLPAFFADPFIADDKLVAVLPEWWAQKHAVYMVRSSNNANPFASAFAEYVHNNIRL